MDITVSSRNLEITEALRETVVDKIGRLDRFVDGMDHAEVHFWEEKNPRIADKDVCEVTLDGHGHHVRCKVAGPDGFTAVDRAVEKLEHQLHKLKTKLVKRHHGAGDDNGGPDPDDATPPSVTSDGAPRIVAVEQPDSKPMTSEEAALQLGVLHYEFLLFANSDTGRAAVVYRRADGAIGLIDAAS